MDLPELIQTYLRQCDPFDEEFEVVRQLAVILERENVKSPHGLHIRLRQWRGERRNGAK